jgi:signal transduction histidine kinase
MSDPLRVLIVEDSEDDTELLLRELRRAGEAPTCQRVEAPAEFLAALRAHDWDVIISDYAMPRFTGLEALELLKRSGLDIPFILISGTVGEDIAVECMKAGANDYLMKDNLTRLVPAVRRELRDATERKQATERQRQLEAQLRQAQKMEALGTLAGGIAHDFNNLLAGIAGCMEIIQSETAAQPAVQAPVQQVLTAIGRAGDLVRRILTFSRKQPASRQAVHLGPVVEEALGLLRALVPRNVTVATDLPSGPTVFADAGQIHQVVMNLFTNALQALGEKSGGIFVSLAPVSVSADFAGAHPPLRPGEHVRLRVRDTGPGMDATTLEHIFEPFFTTKAAGMGTGLGLAMVHGIVRNHDGAVVVHSTLGQGTTFELYFPAEGGPVPAPAPVKPAGPTGQLPHLLVIDDEPFLAQLGASILHRLGYRATAFTDPHQALAALRSAPEQFAGVVTDLRMPKLKGLDLAQMMRAIRPDLPVVLTSGHPGSLDEERARELGFHEVLEKPFRLEKVEDTLRRVLAGKGLGP